jgi:hypothetical protein
MKKYCGRLKIKVLRIKLIIQLIVGIITRNDKNNDEPKDMG